MFAERKKNAILLVLPIEEISLRPELSSPARFRIQGGYPERDGRLEGQITKDKGRKFLFLYRMTKTMEKYSYNFCLFV